MFNSSAESIIAPIVKEINAHNSFDKPNEIKPAVFADAKVDKNSLNVKLPAKSVVVLELK